MFISLGPPSLSSPALCLRFLGLPPPLSLNSSALTPLNPAPFSGLLLPLQGLALPCFSVLTHISVLLSLEFFPLSPRLWGAPDA